MQGEIVGLYINIYSVSVFCENPSCKDLNSCTSFKTREDAIINWNEHN